MLLQGKLIISLSLVLLTASANASPLLSVVTV